MGGALIAILVGMMIIYSILGVGLFSEFSTEDFASFPDAFWTLFITLNGETWPVFTDRLLQKQCWYAALYFGSFIAMAVVICMNMIIAVFIDKTEANIQVKKTIVRQATMNTQRTLSTSHKSSKDIRRMLKDKPKRKEKAILRASSLGRLHVVQRLLEKNKSLAAFCR